MYAIKAPAGPAIPRISPLLSKRPIPIVPDITINCGGFLSLGFDGQIELVKTHEYMD